MSVNVFVKKLHADAKLPVYKTGGSVGMDFYSIEDVVIYAGETKLVKTGIAVALPDGYEIEIRGRSGLSLTQSYLCKHGTIDTDYRGEIGIIIANISQTHDVIQIKAGDRVAQGVVAKVEQVQFIEVDDLDQTERGDGSFGHTGLR